MSSRGKTVFVLTWGSRGSAHINKVAFQRIATAPNVHVYLAIVSRKSSGNSAPRDDIIGTIAIPHLRLMANLLNL